MNGILSFWKRAVPNPRASTECELYRYDEIKTDPDDWWDKITTHIEDELQTDLDNCYIDKIYTEGKFYIGEYDKTIDCAVIACRISYSDKDGFERVDITTWCNSKNGQGWIRISTANYWTEEGEIKSVREWVI